MSGGRLVVLDRAGRDVKYYPLAEGLATLGSDPACDIRIMLPTVSPHHATVVVHSMQTVVQSVSERETLVNGARVSVAALRHGDVIALGGRALRWEYHDRAARRPLQPHPALHRRVQRVRAPRRGSEPPPKDVIVATHRASMPASVSGKQVAIVQPQRRDTSDLSDTASSLPTNKRPRTSKTSNSFSELMENNDKTRRKVSSPRTTLAKLSNPTKATLWIESRKSSPRKSATKPQTPVRSPAKTPVRSPAKTPVESPIQTRKSIRTPGKSLEKPEVTLFTANERRTRTPAKSPEKKAVKTPQRSQNETLTPLRNVRKVVSEKKRYGGTPLRLVVLKKAQSAQKMKVTKIQAPLKMDSTKQAAIMLMTRHTPKSKQPSPAQGKGPSFLVKKPSPVRKTPKQATRSSGRTSSGRPTPKRSSMYGRKKSSEGNRASDKYVSENESLIEITDSETLSSLTRSTTRRSTSRSSLVSPLLPSPKKSALKDPSAKKSSRKTESIKFDLSNLESTSHNRSSDVMLVDETTKNDSISDISETECTLRYSDSSNTKTPTPRSSSRTDRMLERSLGTSVTDYPTYTRRSVRNETSQSAKSPRGIKMIKKALEKSDATYVSSYSRRTTKSLNPTRTSNVSARLTRTLSPRASSNLESYSIVDLVSINSNDSLSNRSGSVYNSAGSVSSNATYDTPLLGSSTPYESRSNSTAVFSVRGSTGRKRSRGLVVSTTMDGKSSLTSDIVTTPENTEDATKTTYNSTRISRASKSRSRINDSDVLLTEEEEDSPKSSKRLTRVSQSSPTVRKNISVNETPSSKSDSPSTVGMHTPENRHSPVEVSTPVLSIQSLLDASQQSLKPRSSPKRNMKRKTIGALRSEPKKVWKSRSLNLGRSLRGRDITANFDRRDNNSQDDEGIVTPTSAVKLVPEGVKNKHSTAKKPKSKRSLIDNLDESDIVKQLFNSPVKRKLSQSMTEFSRKQLFEDDDVRPVRQTRSTIAVVGTTPETSLINNTEAFTPEVFVSPLNTPSNSPNMIGIKRLFQKSTPENDLRNVSGVKALLRTPRTRKSIKNDLTKVTGVKAVFAKSPRNRLSDVRVKEVFAASPKNDLRRVSGVKSLFQSQKKKGKSPRNELDDVRGVRNLFRETRSSPRNDLSDVRGVKQMFRPEKQLNNLSDVSGVEQLFQEPENFDSTFDQLMGRPPIRATYIKAKSFTVNRAGKKKNKKAGSKSLHDSISQITENVQEWLEKELQSRVQRNAESEASTSKGRKSSPNKSKNNSKMILARELQKLSTNTVEGTNTQVIISRTRNSSMIRNENDLSSQKKSASELYGAHTLPIKKRSLVEASINVTNDRFSRSKQLPIKKRAVVHSTPVKGCVNITMNASEIGRMSPISAEKVPEIDTIIRPETQSSPKTKQSPKNKQSTKVKQTPKAKAIEEAKHHRENSIVTANPSPKKTRSAKTAQNTPVKAGRGRKSINEKQELPNVKKRRSSIVITKKAPVISPNPAVRKVTRKGKANLEPEQEVVNPSPKKTRATRGQKLQASAEVKIVTPKKNTRAKVRRSSVVVVKPSPKLKPRSTRRTKETESSVVEQQAQAKGKRKTVAVTKPKPKSNKKTESLQESKVEVEPVRKTRKTIAKAASTSKDESQVAVQPTRTTRKTIVKAESKGNSIDIEILVVQTRRTKKTVENESAQNIKEAPNAQTKRGRKVAESDAIEEPKATKTRGRTVVAQSSVESETTRRGRRTKAEETVVEASAKTKGRKATLEQSVPKTVGRGRKTQLAPESDKQTGKVPDSPPKTIGRGRKRKNTEPEDSSPPKEVPVKATKQTRSTKATINEDKEIKKGKAAKSDSKGAGDASNAKHAEKKAKTTVEPRKTTRSAAQTVVEEKPVRGRKATAAEKVVEKKAPQEGGRKKRSNVDISDAKESKKQPAKRARTAAAPRAPSAPAASAPAASAPAASAPARARRAGPAQPPAAAARRRAR